MMGVYGQCVERRGTNSVKWDFLEDATQDILALSIADMDLPCAEAIVEGIRARANHPIYGYTSNDSIKYMQLVAD